MNILENKVAVITGASRGIGAGINYYIFAVFMPLGIVMPFVITISLCSFIAVYCTYPNIKRIMIDPYYPEAHDDGSDGEEPIFTDRG